MGRVTIRAHPETCAANRLAIGYCPYRVLGELPYISLERRPDCHGFSFSLKTSRTANKAASPMRRKNRSRNVGNETDRLEVLTWRAAPRSTIEENNIRNFRGPITFAVQKVRYEIIATTRVCQKAKLTCQHRRRRLGVLAFQWT